LTKLGWKTGALALGVFGLGVGAATFALGQTDEQPSVRLSPKQIHWVDYPGAAGKLGMQQAILYGNPAKPGVYVIRLKFPPGVISHPHSHPDDRIGAVLKGTLWMGEGTTFDPAATKAVPVGGFFVSHHGEMHFDGAKKEEVILQIVGMGPSGKTSAHPDEPDFTKQ
jgi:quercetin dioxygenase-like cupin family protein